jgi:hypothetical protein
MTYGRLVRCRSDSVKSRNTKCKCHALFDDSQRVRGASPIQPPSRPFLLGNIALTQTSDSCPPPYSVMINRFLSVPLLVGTLFIFGCKTAPDTERPELIKRFVVTQGTTAKELLTNLGEPNLKRPLADYSIDAEVWVYNRKIGNSSKSVYTGTKEHRYWDPFRREMITIQTPVYQPEVTSNVEKTEILLVKNRVYSWERENSGERDIDGLSR